MIESADRLLGWVSRVYLWGAQCLLALLVIVIGTQAVLRYGTSMSMVWAGEVATLSMIWMVFLMAAVLHRRRRHITVSVLSDRLEGIAGRIAESLVSLGTIVLVAVICAQIGTVWPFVERLTTPVLGISRGVFLLGIAVGLITIALQELVNLGRSLLGPGQVDRR